MEPLFQLNFNIFKDKLKAFNDFKNMQKSVWSNFFLICKSMFILKVYSMQMLKFPSHKINGTTTVLFFLSRAAIHHSFTFNLQFLYELKRKVHPSKTLYEIFHFQYRFIIKVYIFVQQNAWTLWLQKVIIPFKIKTTEQPQTVLLPNLWFSSYN